MSGHLERGMLTYLEKYRDGAAFGPERIAILVEAYDAASASMASAGAPFVQPEYREEAREIIARHIIDGAKAGEWDARKLSDGALQYLTRIDMRRPRTPR
jgi:hypothetical protein